VYVDIDKVKPNSYNPNVMDEEKFNALVDFCKTNGADKLDPVWLRNNGDGAYEIIDGEHRWKAAKEVGWKRLRAFVIGLSEDEGKAFNVRKNRERGKLDAHKLGKILYEEYEKGQTQNGVGKKFGLSRELARDYIEIYKNEEKIREKLNIGAKAPLPYRKARDIMRELKREERGEPPKPTFKPTENSKNLEKFLTTYAKALEKTPKPVVQTDEVQLAIDFFKRVLNDKHVTCPKCGEEHLQWRCGHEF